MKMVTTIRHYWFLVVIGNFLAFENVHADFWSDLRDGTVDVVERGVKDIGNAPKSWSRCISRVDKCVEKETRQLGYRLAAPAISGYKQILERRADGHWKALPSLLQSAAARHYPNIDLGSIRYAEGIDTIHGSAITISHRIYFPRKISLGNYGDLEWMLHEIEHVSQYKKRGGEKQFLSQYLLKSAGKVFEKGHFDVHDFVGPERGAIRKASNITRNVFDSMQNNSLTQQRQTLQRQTLQRQTLQRQTLQRQTQIQPSYQQTSICQTPNFWCQMGQVGAVGHSCFCNSNYGRIWGTTVPQ